MDNATALFIYGEEFPKDSVVLAYCIDGYNPVTQTITSYNQLIDCIDEIKILAKKHIPINFSIDIIRSDGYISAGLGENESVIVWYIGHDGDFVTSLGNEQAEGETLYYFGDWSEMSNKYAVTWENALLVMKNWVEHRDISDCITWTSELY